MTANQRKRKCLIQKAYTLFRIADDLKAQSSALLRKADELRNAMRMSQARVHNSRGLSAGDLEAVAIRTGA